MSIEMQEVNSYFGGLEFWGIGLGARVRSPQKGPAQAELGQAILGSGDGNQGGASRAKHEWPRAGGAIGKTVV